MLFSICKLTISHINHVNLKTNTCADRVDATYLKVTTTRFWICCINLICATVHRNIQNNQAPHPTDQRIFIEAIRQTLQQHRHILDKAITPFLFNTVTWPTAQVPLNVRYLCEYISDIEFQVGNNGTCLFASHHGFSNPYVIMCHKNLVVPWDLSNYIINNNQYLPCFQVAVESRIMRMDPPALELCKRYLRESFLTINSDFLLSMLNKIEHILYGREE